MLSIPHPATLVLYGDHPPSLGRWRASFALPSVLSLLATYGVLRWVEGSRLAENCEREVDQPKLSAGGWTALVGIGITGVALLVFSALDQPLGLPTCILGVLTALVVLARKREAPWATLKGVSWAVLPLVAGLFVLVEALNRTGVTPALANLLRRGAATSRFARRRPRADSSPSSPI